jgi:DNA-binding NarL/FixJ family response regulator
MARNASATPGTDDPVRFPLDSEVWQKVAEEMRLSPQQRRIVEMLLLGRKCKQIGPALGISGSTVETYLKRIYQRQGVADHTELLLHIMALSHQCNGQPKRPGKP